MGRYVQGAAFYLFIYLMLGLINTGIIYFLTKFLHIYPAISLALLMFLTIFVLYFGFEKSIEIFFQRKPGKGRLILGWMVQFITFLTFATLLEKWMAGAVLNHKLFKILTVFVNFAVFFVTYYLSVRLIVVEKEFEA